MSYSKHTKCAKCGNGILIRAIKLGLICYTIASFSACDHGLEPPPKVKPGFGGRITYKGEWPPADSIKLLAVVAFKHYPPTNILIEVLSGNAIYDTALTKNVESQDYQIFTDPATFEYVVVAQQYGPDIFSQWRVIGVYSDDPLQATPKTVDVPAETFISGVDITVDFEHPPPQVLGKLVSQ
jgi:hypothetical protein